MGSSSMTALSVRRIAQSQAGGRSYQELRPPSDFLCADSVAGRPGRMLPFLGQRNSHRSQALQGSMRQNKSTIAPAFHPPLLCLFRTPDSHWGYLSEIRVDGSAALLGVARRGLSLCFSLYRVEVSIGCKVCLPFHLRVLCFLTQERAKLIENGFILMRDVSSNSRSANTGAPSWRWVREGCDLRWPTLYGNMWVHVRRCGAQRADFTNFKRVGRRCPPGGCLATSRQGARRQC